MQLLLNTQKHNCVSVDILQLSVDMLARARTQAALKF
jgi:hypothetical protein